MTLSAPLVKIVILDPGTKEIHSSRVSDLS
jgi:hypothetical protein